MLLYGYCTGVASSRRIAQRLHEDIAFRVLAANNTPDFRKDHLEALADLFLQVLELCKQAGLLKLGHVALDGTKVRANASKHKAMSYDADVLRAGRTARVLGFTAKAPSTLGTFLRSFRWGHVRQLDRVSRELLARAWQAGAGPGDAPFTIDLDSTICETYGLAKEGARHAVGALRRQRRLAGGTGDGA